MNTTHLRTLTLGLVMAITSATSSAANMVSVTERVNLAAPPAKTWDTIKDFMGWQAWHPAFAKTDLVSGTPNTAGAIRLLTTKDGARFTEELMAHDAASRTYQYRILESPAPVLAYVSTLQVQAHGAGSTVVWNSTFKVKEGTPEDEAKKAIAGIYRLGLDNLAAMQQQPAGERQGK